MLDQQLTDEFSRGVSTAKAGNPLLAKDHFHKVLQIGDPTLSAEAWIWLAWLSDSPAAAVHCLECAIEISPNHAIAHQALAWNQYLANYQLAMNQGWGSNSRHTAARDVATNEPSLEEPAAKPGRSDDAFDDVHIEVSEPAHLGTTWPTAQPVEPAIIDHHDHEQLQSDVPSLAGWQRAVDQVEIASNRLTPSETCDWITQQLEEETEPEPSQTAPSESADLPDTSDRERAVDQQTPVWMPQRLEPESPRQSESQQPQLRADWREQLRSQSQKRKADGHVEPEDELVERVDEITSFVTPIELPPSVDVTADHAEDVHHAAETSKFKSIPDSGSTVLIVDDSPTVRKLVTLTLEKQGYRVISACDGVAAIREMAAHVPNLVLLDINMPRLDGYKLCKLIKKHDTTRNIPVVMLAGKDGMFDRLRGRLVGCSDYIAKPFDSTALLSKVHDYLPKSHAADSHEDGLAVRM